MTVIKEYKRLWALITAVLSAIILFTASCTDNRTEASDSTAETTVPESEAHPETVLILAENGKSDYKIVFPISAPDYMKIAEDIAGKLKNAGFSGIQTGYDISMAGKPNPEKEILIGPCERPESKAAAEGLKAGEYSVTVSGEKIVIYGNGIDATKNAVALFLRKILSGNGDKITFSSSDEILNKQKFPIESFTIGGRDIGDFSIVIPKNSGAARWYAGLLRYRISVRTGIKPEILEGKSSSNGCEIRLGNFEGLSDPGRNRYSVSVSGTVLTAYASDAGGLFDAYYALYDEVFGMKEKKISLDDSFSLSGDTSTAFPDKAPDGAIRIVYHNVLGYLGTDDATPVLNRADAAYDLYLDLDPDIICFEEAGPKYRVAANSFYANYKKNGFVEIVFTSEGGQGNPIYYRADRMDLVESGYAKSRNGDKGTTYAVFKRKSDGKLFGVTNSHFAANSNANNDPVLGNTYRTEDAGACVKAALAIKNKYPGITVVMGGDYNSATGSDPIKAVEQSGAVHVRTLLSLWNTLPSAHHAYPSVNASIGDYDPYTAGLRSGSASIDHVFLLGDSFKPISYNVLTDITALTTSDHTIHFIDIAAK